MQLYYIFVVWTVSLE